MKALVLSDSHRNFGSILRAMEQEQKVDLIIHAGDVQQDVDDIMDMWPQCPCAYVLGNNDFGVFGVPGERLFTFGGKTIFLTHGHLYGVRTSSARVEQEARKRGADICIFGHTHCRVLEERNGLWLMNPGAASRSYGVIEILDGKVSLALRDN